MNFGRIATGVMVVLGLAVGAVHSPDQQPALHLSAERAGLHQPADRVLLRARNSVAALNGAGAISSLLTGFVMGAARFVCWKSLTAQGTRIHRLMRGW